MVIGIFGVGDIMWIRVGRNEEKIAEYVRNQLQEDIAEDQISMKEFIDPFTGSRD